MASAWGSSWGSSWADSWGAIGAGELTASASITLDALTSETSATVALVGSAEITLGALTVTDTTQVALVASASAMLADVTLSASALDKLAASTSATLDAVTLASGGTVTLSGSLAKTLAALTISATALARDDAVAHITLESLTAVGSADALLLAATNGVLADISLSTTVSVALVAQADITLDDLTIVATSSHHWSVASADIALDDLTVTASGTIELVAVASASLDDLTGAATATVFESASADITLGDMTASVTGIVRLIASSEIVLGDIGGDLTANVDEPVEFAGYLVCASISISPRVQTFITLGPALDGLMSVHPTIDGALAMAACSQNSQGFIAMQPKKPLQYGEAVSLGLLPGGSAITNWWDVSECISGNGRVAVMNAVASDGQFHIARWTERDGLVDLGVVSGGTYSCIGGAGKPSCSHDGSVIVGRADGFGGTSWHHQHAVKWTPDTGFVDLGGLAGATYTGANGCSADGSVVACFTNLEAAFWTEATGIKRLRSLTPTPYGNAFCVSANGKVFGGHSTNIEDVEVAAIWRGDTQPIEIGTLWTPANPGWVGSDVYALSHDGEVAIGATRLPDANGQRQWRGFRWTSDGMICLGDTMLYIEFTGCNATGDIIVGNAWPSDAGTNYGFVYQQGTGIVQLAPAPSQVMNISADGKVIAGDLNNIPALWRAI